MTGDVSAWSVDVGQQQEKGGSRVCKSNPASVSTRQPTQPRCCILVDFWLNPNIEKLREKEEGACY